MKRQNTYFSDKIRENMNKKPKDTKIEDEEQVLITYYSEQKDNSSDVEKKEKNNTNTTNDEKIINLINHQNIRNSSLFRGLSKNHVANIYRMKELNTYFNSMNDLKIKTELTNNEIKLLQNNYLELEKNKKTLSKNNNKNRKIKRKNTKNHEKIDINKATKSDLMRINNINSYYINKIIILRKKGIVFNSYSDLRKKLNLSSEQLNEIKKVIKIEEKIPNKTTNHKNYPIKSTTKKNIKINFNTCSKKEIENLNIFSQNEITKLINYRENGNEFNFYKDFKDKLNISNEKINLLIKSVVMERDFHKKNPPKKPSKIMKTKINFNTCDENQLRNFKDLTSSDVNKIIILRKNGIKFNSFEDLEKKAEIPKKTITNLEKFLEIETNEKKDIIPDTTNNIKQIDNLLNEKSSQKKKIKETKKKIDINSADEKTLTQIPSINLIKAKKIIELRNQNRYIKSYEDLNTLLSLKPQQIEQIKDTTIISKHQNVPGRIIDL